ELERVDHVVVRDAHDAAGGLEDVDVEGVRDRPKRTVDGWQIGLDLAAAEVVRVDPPEREVRVRGRRRCAAAAIGGRTGDGACRLRPDVQLPEFVDVGDAAAAVPDLHQVDDRDHDRVAG